MTRTEWSLLMLHLLHDLSSNTLYALAKQSKNLGAYKLARDAFQKLQALRVPPALQETVDLGCLTICSKPFHDKEASTVQSVCPSMDGLTAANPLQGGR